MLIKEKLGNMPKTGFSSVCLVFFFFYLKNRIGVGFSTDALTGVAKISVLHFSFGISNLEADYIESTPSSKNRLCISALGLKKQIVKKWKGRFYAQSILQIMFSGRFTSLIPITEHSDFCRQLV